MLFVPTATRMNFWARKLTSLVAFEHENMPTPSGPRRSTTRRKPCGGAIQRLIPTRRAEHATFADQGGGETVVRRCRFEHRLLLTVRPQQPAVLSPQRSPRRRAADRHSRRAAGSAGAELIEDRRERREPDVGDLRRAGL